MEEFLKTVFTILGTAHLLFFGLLLFIGLLWLGLFTAPIIALFSIVYLSVRNAIRTGTIEEIEEYTDEQSTKLVEAKSTDE